VPGLLEQRRSRCYVAAEVALPADRSRSLVFEAV
jgi:hypothetical protein